MRQKRKAKTKENKKWKKPSQFIMNKEISAEYDYNYKCNNNKYNNNDNNKQKQKTLIYFTIYSNKRADNKEEKKIEKIKKMKDRE